LRIQKKFTEKETIRKTYVDLNYCEIMEKRGMITLDELADLIPGYIHLNSNESGGLLYISQKALEIFERDINEVIEMGPKFLMEITDLKSQKAFLQKKIFFENDENSLKTFNHMQRLHYPRKRIPYTLFYTTSKVYDGDDILSFTQPLESLHNGTCMNSIIHSSYDFYNTHFEQFQQLTKREREILMHVVEGKDSKKIAEILYVSFHTIRTHRKNICAKLETSKLSDFEKYVRAFLE